MPLEINVPTQALEIFPGFKPLILAASFTEAAIRANVFLRLNIKTALGLRKIFSAIPNLFEQFWRKPFLYQRN